MSQTEDPSARQSPGGRTLGQLATLDVELLKGVGPKKRKALGPWGVDSVLELLWKFPLRYIDRSRQADLADLAIGDEAVVLGRVTAVTTKRARNNRTYVVAEVDDGTGTMEVTFFNQPWRAQQLRAGAEALFFGKLDEFRGRPKMTNPVVDLLVGAEGRAQGASKAGRIVPVYPQSSKVGLTSWEVGTFVAEALERAGRFADPLDEELLDRLDLADRTDAMWGIHAPSSMEETVPARRRLAFDELLRLQLALVMRRRTMEAEQRGIEHQVTGAEVDGDAAPVPTMVTSFLGGLPFTPTPAQRRVLKEIFGDLAAPVPMHRLLQGDVGSGKTVVAVATMLAAVQGGHQAALMAPTEVLAEQHAASIRALISEHQVVDPGRLDGHRPVDLRVLTSSVSAAERREILAGLTAGSVDLVIGTHALLTDDVAFSSLGVVVVDEQHRFGVEQRSALRDKGRGTDGSGRDPDLLVMTATPIPRTAAMVVFGDLRMSIIDELPEGRTPIVTRWARTDLEVLEAWGTVRSEVAAGNQAYVVCPLVDESEKIEAASAAEEFERLGATELSGLRLGLLHGQLKTAEKDAVMRAFRAKELDVLVATTVIEVGVDVPAATVMVIEDADRFGIAQLHQLRGRVGRGTSKSWCFLLSSSTSSDAAERLGALERTTDGFELAEVDLKLRGEGTILGARQKGRSDLTLASLTTDLDLLLAAREVAEIVTSTDPLLTHAPLLADELRVTLDPEDAAFLFKS